MTDSVSIQFLEKAISQLENGMQEYKKTQTSDLLRDGVIQRFEYTYELAWKTLKRFLETTQPSLTTIDQLSFPTLIRTAWEQGLLKSGWNVWKTFREARNQTSHAYDEKKARKVFAIIPKFLDEVYYLYQQLQKSVG